MVDNEGNSDQGIVCMESIKTKRMIKPEKVTENERRAWSIKPPQKSYAWLLADLALARYVVDEKKNDRERAKFKESINP